MSELTRILDSVQHGDSAAAEKLLPLVYDELRKLAARKMVRELPGQTIRDYPDITHSRHCQYPVPNWDLAFALTEGREPINPRPTQMANIFRKTTLPNSIATHSPRSRGLAPAH